MGKGRPAYRVYFCAWCGRRAPRLRKFCSAEHARLAQHSAHDPDLQIAPEEIQRTVDLLIGSAFDASDALRELAGELSGRDLERGQALAQIAAKLFSVVSALVTRRPIQTALQELSPSSEEGDNFMLTRLKQARSLGGMLNVARQTKEDRPTKSQSSDYFVPMFVSFRNSELLLADRLGVGKRATMRGTFQGFVRYCLERGLRTPELVAAYKKQTAARARAAKRRKKADD